jgi:hypothetical protein
MLCSTEAEDILVLLSTHPKVFKLNLYISESTDHVSVSCSDFSVNIFIGVNLKASDSFINPIISYVLTSHINEVATTLNEFKVLQNFDFYLSHKSNSGYCFTRRSA